VEIQIWDTGRGIPADQQAMVFEEFVQLQNPARDREQGLGLGLALVRRAAVLLQHPLKLVSVTGRGSMFCPEIGDLPATGSSRAPPPAAAQGLSTLASLPTTKYDICRIAQRRR
jgi:K+-sensing histidine kinase KdpD